MQYKVLLLPVLFILIALWFWAGEQLTPRSVHVSGYTRSDGTEVSSYNRRPPGGAQHDASYEMLQYVTIVLFVGIIVYLIKSISAFNKLNFRQELEKEINFSIVLPATPHERRIKLPAYSKTPRIEWVCSECFWIIKPNSKYYSFVENPKRYSDKVMCESCYQLKTKEYKLYEIEKEEYEEAMQSYKYKKDEMFKNYYREKFGKEYTTEEGKS